MIQNPNIGGPMKITLLMIMFAQSLMASNDLGTYICTYKSDKMKSEVLLDLSYGEISGHIENNEKNEFIQLLDDDIYYTHKDGKLVVRYASDDKLAFEGSLNDTKDKMTGYIYLVDESMNEYVLDIDCERD